MNDFLIKLYLRDLASDSQHKPIEEPPADSLESFDDSARERLVMGHLPSVVRMAFGYQGRGVPLSDLINEGNIGLMRAAERFDPVRKVRFAHYAGPWIRTQMDRALSYQAWPVSLPADFNWRRGQVRGAEERLAAKLNRRPKDTELARDCGLELPAVKRLRTASLPSFVGLESAWPGDEAGLTLAEVLPDETLARPDQEVARRSDREFVGTLLKTLTPTEQRVIKLRYGLDGGGGYTLTEVGRTLGYVRQGIHRIESSALGKLRQHAHFMQITPKAAKNGGKTKVSHGQSLSLALVG
jgi:RNA polymerase sigma factor (sigma-70 family)